MYALLSRAFSFPSAELHAEVAGGGWLDELTAALRLLPHHLGAGEPATWRVPAGYDEFQSQYIRLFEMGGRGGAPCPLHSGHYSRDRLRAMEELVRFYNFFGLKIAPGLMPDHVTVEMEFMQFLTDVPSEARDTSGDSRSYLRAQRDFLTSHLGRPWPIAALALKRERALPFYRSLVALTARFLEAEQRYVERALVSA